MRRRGRDGVAQTLPLLSSGVSEKCMSWMLLFTFFVRDKFKDGLERARARRGGLLMESDMTMWMSTETGGA